ncbi:MAG: acyl-CoA-binding protein [Chitinophagaceae bacterium]
MQDLHELFKQAEDDSKLLSKAPDNETELQLYALNKQATKGNATEQDAPLNPLNFVEKAKFKAWQKLEGKPRNEAMQEYIDLVNKLK